MRRDFFIFTKICRSRRLYYCTCREIEIIYLYLVKNIFMKAKIYIILLICLINYFPAQSQLFLMYDGLNPNDNYFDLPKYRLEYYQKIKEKLYEGLEEDFHVRMLVRPSFDAEYIFQVDRDNKNYEAESFVVRFQKTKSNLWYAKEDYQKINIKKHQARINKEDAELLTNAFVKLVRTT